MQWNAIQKDWKNVSKSFKAKWPKLTDADITAIGGKREQLLERLVTHYKSDRMKLVKDVEEFIKTMKAQKA